MSYQFMQGRSRILSATYTAAAATATDAILAAYTDDGAEAVFTADDLDAQPDVPRAVTATAGGTSGDIKAIQVIVTGKNVWGETITETLPAFTVNTTGTVQGSKAFYQIDSITIPAHDGTGATTAIGVNDKLGLPVTLTRNTVVAAYLNGVKEGTPPTVTVDSDEVEKNTVDLNSALDGNDVIVDYYK